MFNIFFSNPIISDSKLEVVYFETKVGEYLNVGSEVTFPTLVLSVSNCVLCLESFKTLRLHILNFESFKVFSELIGI